MVWMSDLKRRIQHIEKLEQGHSQWLQGMGSLEVWLGGLFQPGAFLTATRQWTARLSGIPLEALKLSISIGNNSISAPSFSVSFVLYISLSKCLGSSSRFSHACLFFSLQLLGAHIHGAEWHSDRGHFVLGDSAGKLLENVTCFWTKDEATTGKKPPSFFRAAL
jgi:hypothetical protein